MLEKRYEFIAGNLAAEHHLGDIVRHDLANSYRVLRIALFLRVLLPRRAVRPFAPRPCVSFAERPAIPTAEAEPAERCLHIGRDVLPVAVDDGPAGAGHEDAFDRDLIAGGAFVARGLGDGPGLAVAHRDLGGEVRMGLEPAIERGEADREGAGEVRRVGAEAAQDARAGGICRIVGRGTGHDGGMGALRRMLNRAGCRLRSFSRSGPMRAAGLRTGTKPRSPKPSAMQPAIWRPTGRPGTRRAIEDIGGPG